MQFYVLQPVGGLMFGTRYAYGEPVKPAYTDVGMPVCPACHQTVGMLKWLPPHQVKLSSADPRKWCDFVWGAGFNLLASSRFREIYEQEGLKGIVLFYPQAEIVRIGNRKTGELPSNLPVYHETEIEMLGPELDMVASSVVLSRGSTERCHYCHIVLNGRKLRQERVVINPLSWQGEDIFAPRGNPQFIVSERFRRVVEGNGLTNASFIPCEKYAYKEPYWFVRDD